MSELRNCVLVCFLLFASQMAGALPNAWIATWAASPQTGLPDPKEPLRKIDNQTVRERVRVSVGGSRICLRLSNEYGSTPLLVGAVTVAEPVDPATVKPTSTRTVTFSGQKSVTIPGGAPMVSDPVEFPVTSGEEISISLYFPRRVSTPTLHGLALKRAVVSQQGDQTRAEKIEGGALSKSSIALSAVLVPAQPAHHLVVAFGDSIVDGDGSSLDADRNWPSDLVRRLEKASKGSKVAVVNEGIIGNRLLSDGEGFGASALARFDRDVLAQPGLTHIVLLEGINDIAFPGARLNGECLADPSEARAPQDLIAAYRQLITRAHSHGIKLIGATLTPFEGVVFAQDYYTESKEATRQAVNQWIRTSGAFDAVIDFDGVVRDPDHPSRLLPRFASKDHLHPNDAGYEAMANAIDVSLFK